MIYAAGYNSSILSIVIDAKTNKVVDDIPVEKTIIDLSVNPQTNMIYAVGI